MFHTFSTRGLFKCYPHYQCVGANIDDQRNKVYYLQTHLLAVGRRWTDEKCESELRPKCGRRVPVLKLKLVLITQMINVEPLCWVSVIKLQKIWRFIYTLINLIALRWFKMKTFGIVCSVLIRLIDSHFYTMNNILNFRILLEGKRNNCHLTSDWCHHLQLHPNAANLKTRDSTNNVVSKLRRSFNAALAYRPAVG